jgi:putative CocE/NonD family hydrolase
VPALNVGGWYDLFLGGTLENFARMQAEAGSEAARQGVRLVVGPWAHGTTFGQYPDHSFAEFGDEGELNVAELQLEFFRSMLDGEPGDGPPVRIFVMGQNRWRDEEGWPLARAREERWFLRSGTEEGLLSRDPPGDEQPDSYEYDPRDPAPTIGGPTSLPARFMRTNSGPLDQRPVEERADVLLYSSEPLDRPLEVTGPLAVVLYAATTAPDTDFVAKLTDVWPDGSSRILAEGILRARFRESFAEPRPLAPGSVEAYRIDLVATSNLFLPGHRIRLVVTSSSFPRFDRNANTGQPFGTDTEEDLTPSRQTIFHDGGRASHVLLPVVPR